MNRLLCDNNLSAKTPWTKDVWMHDFLTNMNFTLQTRRLRYVDITNFIAAYNPENRHKRKESERFERFTYNEIVARDKTNLDIIWLTDDSLADLDNLPAPDLIAAEIVENLEAVIEK